MPFNPFSPSSDADPVTPRPASGPFPEIPDADTLKANASASHTDQAAALQPATSHTDTEPVTAGQAAAAVRESSAEIAAVTDTPADPEMDVTTDASRRGEPGVIYQEPEPEKDTPTPEPAREVNSSPSADGQDAAGEKRRRLTTREAKEIRNKYQYLRELAESPESPDDWRSVRSTEIELGRKYDASQATIRSVVLGLTFKNAGGPIDHHRRDRHDQYLINKNNLGPEVARSMNMSYRETPVVPSGKMVVEVQKPGKHAREYIYPPGTRITAYILGQDGQDNADQDTEAGK